MSVWHVNILPRAALRHARSFPSACPWVSLCVYAEGFHRGREMPTKIIFETEEQAMDDDVDTSTEATTLKVSSGCHVALVALKYPFETARRRVLAAPRQHVAGHANRRLTVELTEGKPT